MAMQQSSPLLTGVVQFVPTVERILYGVGVVGTHLDAEVERLRGRRVLLLTPRSLERGPLAERVRAVLGPRLVESLTAHFEHVSLESVAEVRITVGTFSNSLSCNKPDTSIGDARRKIPRPRRSSQ